MLISSALAVTVMAPQTFVKSYQIENAETSLAEGQNKQQYLEKEAEKNENEAIQLQLAAESKKALAKEARKLLGQERYRVNYLVLCGIAYDLFTLDIVSITSSLQYDGEAYEYPKSAFEKRDDQANPNRSHGSFAMITSDEEDLESAKQQDRERLAIIEKLRTMIWPSGFNANTYGGHSVEEFSEDDITYMQGQLKTKLVWYEGYEQKLRKVESAKMYLGWTLKKSGTTRAEKIDLQAKAEIQQLEIDEAEEELRKWVATYPTHGRNIDAGVHTSPLGPSTRQVIMFHQQLLQILA